MPILRRLTKRPYSRFLIFLFLLIIFFSLQYAFFYHRTQSFYFADENEHLTPAWEMLNYGKTLYADLVTNHQPLPVLTAVIFWKIFPFTNLFMLIERLRLFLYLLSFLGALLMTVRFGWKGFFASLFMELIKFYFFGYHLLAESLAVYPVMFLAGILWENRFSPEPNQSFNLHDDCLFGLGLFLVFIDLSPAWPFLIMIASFYWFLRINRKNFSYPGLLCCLILPLISLFTLIKPSLWFKNTVIFNYRFFLPYESAFSLTGLPSYLLFPFTGLFHPEQPVGRYYLLLFFIFLLNGIKLFLSEKKKPAVIIYLLIIYLLFVSLNLRVKNLNVGFYSAFHLLPQAAFLTMTVVELVSLTLVKPAKRKREIKFFLLNISLAGLLLISSSGWWLESFSINKIREHYIQYGEEESVGMAIKAVKIKNSTLLAGSQSSYINILSGIPLATGQTAYLPWGYRTPELRDKFNQTINESPPAFIYFPLSENPYFQSLIPVLKNNYVRIRRWDGGITDLYLLKKDLSKISKRQWVEFENLFYKQP